MGYYKAMSTPFHHHELSCFGIGTTGFWTGVNPGLADCITEAVRSYGVNVLDTAEMYGSGRSEEALGKVIRSLNRDELFLVDKILPENAVEEQFETSLNTSLSRLGVDVIDLCLLHWREKADLSFVADAMEKAVQAGKIRYWGVSNFDVEDLQDLSAVKYGDRCFCNQIFYNVYERGVEWELLPMMKAQGILPMSYSSLGSDYHPHPDIHANQAVMRFCEEAGFAPEALMLRLNVEMGFCTLFATSSLDHLRANLREIPDEVYQQFKIIIDQEFPGPDHRYPLVKI